MYEEFVSVCEVKPEVMQMDVDRYTRFTFDRGDRGYSSAACFLVRFLSLNEIPSIHYVHLSEF